MKTKWVLLTSLMTLSLSLSFNAFAEAPFARTCRIEGGQPWTVDLHTKNDLMLCVFNGAAVGAAEFAVYKWGKGQGESLKVFLGQNSQLNANSVCADLNADQRISKDSEGNSWSLCVFADGSVVESNTLAGGVSSPQNEALVQALH